MIDKQELINYFEKLAESYENAGLPSWIDFQTLIEHIEFFDEH